MAFLRWRHQQGRVLLLAAALVVLGDTLLIALIIARVPYTKIDWDAYMEQVAGFRAGERNYAELQGDTGPLVYPAGFLYIYSAIQYLTGGAVFPAQIFFGALYVLNLCIVLLIYMRTTVVPWWVLFLLSLSKRVHSIFVLRLFNDSVATTLVNASILLFQSQCWYLGMLLFSFAVSVKMNVLLYAPGLLLVLLKALSLGGVLVALFIAAALQVLLGWPFLWSYPVAYISRAFNLGRVFIHFWSVNFKFVPETIFVSKQFAVILLILHLILLFLFAQYKWCKHEGGIFAASGLTMQHQPIEKPSSWTYFLGKSSALSLRPFKRQLLEPDHIVTVLFTANFIGVVCARSLHYQFYSWYFYTLPFLLWKAPFPTSLRLLLFALVELFWNIYPSTSYSSLGLVICHLITTWGLWYAPIEYPYARNRTKDQMD